MASSNYWLSFALAGFVLTAATSVVNCRTEPRSFIQIAGQLFCNASPVPKLAGGIEVTLFCSISPLTPPSETNDLGAFDFFLMDDEATVFDEKAGDCSVYVTKPVTGCIELKPGEALKAKLIKLSFFRKSYITQGFQTVVLGSSVMSS